MFGKLDREYDDAKHLGMLVPLRHLAGALGWKTFSTTIKGVGKVTLRPGSTDIYVLRQVFHKQEYNFSWQKQYARLPKAIARAVANGQTPVIVDCGANIGASSLYFARRYPQATVLAVEPDPGNAALCRINTLGLSNIVTHEAAIGSSPGCVELVSDTPFGAEWAFQTRRAAEGSVAVVTINDLLASIPNAVPGLGKIDIEGFEEDLFSANTEWLDRTTVVIVEPHDWLFDDRATSRTLQSAMGKRNFDLLISAENLVYVNRDEPAIGAPAGT